MAPGERCSLLAGRSCFARPRAKRSRLQRRSRHAPTGERRGAAGQTRRTRDAIRRLSRAVWARRRRAARTRSRPPALRPPSRAASSCRDRRRARATDRRSPAEVSLGQPHSNSFAGGEHALARSQLRLVLAPGWRDVTVMVDRPDGSPTSVASDLASPLNRPGTWVLIPVVETMLGGKEAVSARVAVRQPTTAVASALSDSARRCPPARAVYLPVAFRPGA
jgi:hypothetical protein